MKFDKAILDKYVEDGLLKKQTSPTWDLSIYNYTDKCTYDKAWDKITLACRGLIVDGTGEVVAHPFPKFFNINEMPQTTLSALPRLPYTITEKYDGSLGILFHYEGKPYMASRGSFTSDQANMANQILQKYNLESLPQGITLLFEIIYPANRFCAGARLVCDYGDQEDLVLLSGYDLHTGEEVSRDVLLQISAKVGFPIAKKYEYTIDEMIALQSTLPPEKEGFVIRYDNGLRVKIKGAEYCKIHRIVNDITPLFLHSLMCENEAGFFIPEKYKISVPEEYLHEVELIEHLLQDKYDFVEYEMGLDVFKFLKDTGWGLENELPTETKEFRKSLGLWIKANEVNHSSALFPFFLNEKEKLRNYIFKTIRPTGNVL